MFKRYRFLSLVLTVFLFFTAAVPAAAFGEYRESTSLNMPQAHAFILKWRNSGGSELGSSQNFILDLCRLIGVNPPETPRPSSPANIYVFEKPVKITGPNGKTTTGRIDLAKQGCFIWESKQGSFKPGPDNEKPYRSGTALRDTKGWDKAMMDAFNQAVNYAQALKREENWYPPFLIVADIGYVIEIYSDFNGTGIYTPFPSAREHRIYLEDLTKPENISLLNLIWTDPLSLDPSRLKEAVTRDVAVLLGDLAVSLEQSGYSQEEIALFLMRCIFCFYAEDCELLPKDSFRNLLAATINQPELFAAKVTELWATMYTGGRSNAVNEQIRKFEGALFKDVYAIELNTIQLEILLRASYANWAAVDSSIFGVMLQQALTPEDRARQGAHYTPPAYVETLVIPTVIEPLREQWEETKRSALDYVIAGEYEAAVTEVEKFHMFLSGVRVLDPSCGSGNFLVVTMSLMKDLEGEVLAALRDLGKDPVQIERYGNSVSPDQFLGVEVMPTAAQISELVLWINYLQLHYKVHGNFHPQQPIFNNISSIECRDAVLAWDGIENGVYINPRPADPWPATDYIVGNPPFVGSAKMNRALTSDYTRALRAAYPEIPATCDYVLYWWYRAAKLTQDGEVERFGFITTNSITQQQNRKMLEYFLNHEKPLYLAYAIPDHPWTGDISAARVRIAMTVCAAGKKTGWLYENIYEKKLPEGFSEVYFSKTEGYITPVLTIGGDITRAVPLIANQKIAFNGMTPNGKGFVISAEQSKTLGLGTVPGLENHIKPYRNGNDISQKCENRWVIDLHGLDIKQVEMRYPAVYEWLLKEVKPQREKSSSKRLRENWWLFDSSAIELREATAGLSRYIVTVDVSAFKHFVFIDNDILPSNSLIAIASDDPFVLGVLMSDIHDIWITANASTLGKASRYSPTACFENFPFPEADRYQIDNIRQFAERIDSHRKTRQSMYPDLTLAQMYRVMEKLYYGVYLSEAENKVVVKGDLVFLLQLHQELDKTVLDAYGWPGDMKSENILDQLIKLNNERAEKEKAGELYKFPAIKNDKMQIGVNIDIPNLFWYNLG